MMDIYPFDQAAIQRAMLRLDDAMAALRMARERLERDNYESIDALFANLSVVLDNLVYGVAFAADAQQELTRELKLYTAWRTDYQAR